MVSVESFNSSGLQAQFNHGITVSTLLDLNLLDMDVLEKARRVLEIIDMACPFDTRILEKEREQIHHYQDLKVEIRKMWNCKSVSVVLAVV